MRTLMGSPKVMAFSFTLCILILKWVGSSDGARLTEEEDLELEKQVWNMNKLSIKTVKTRYGDEYNCIDFYKQPAFDHPMLKNHNFHPEMRPASLGRRDWNDPLENESMFKTFEDGGCPNGSVPIRRMTKLDLIRQKEYHSLRSGSFGADVFTDIAVVQTIARDDIQYCGAATSVLINRPASNIAQYSASRLRVQNGDDAVQIGWRVDPALYGDNNSRFYTYFKAGRLDCYNLICPGFVVVNKQYPLEYVFDDFYKIGDNYTIEVSLSLTRDQANGNWWVQVGPTQIGLGFWPASIFTGGLNNMATHVDWGGEAYNGDNTSSVDMGLGYIPKEFDPIRNGFSRNITVTTPYVEDPSGFYTYGPDTVVYASDPDKYQVIDKSYAGDYYRHVATFGGPKHLTN